MPKSNFIESYEARRASSKRGVPPLRWQPVSLGAMPSHLRRAVILAEDSRFYEHGGFDLIAFKEAMTRNWEEGEIIFGASTISQQTVKNLFLSPARTPWRKWHELILTWGMENNVSKRRILELYLNLAEFGPGVYGAQAAAQTYYGVSVSDLTVTQAAELVASLPGPSRHNPATRTAFFRRRTQKILDFLTRYPGEAAQTVSHHVAITNSVPHEAVAEPVSDANADTI